MKIVSNCLNTSLVSLLLMFCLPATFGFAEDANVERLALVDRPSLGKRTFY